MEPSTSELFNRMFELEMKISWWSFSISQSNPGAVMHLRDMQRELHKIKIVLFGTDSTDSDTD
jgi:hypothetical protein